MDKNQKLRWIKAALLSVSLYFMALFYISIYNNDAIIAAELFVATFVVLIIAVFVPYKEPPMES